MKISNPILIFIGINLFLLPITLMSFTHYSNTKHQTVENTRTVEIKTALERAYFEGQKDAINGDVRIKLNSDSIYVWTKSPWNDGMRYSFVPTKEDTYK